MDKIKTGILIREARTKKNYTQSELGDLLGVSNKAISRWENGESFPDVGILERLATVLDMRIQDIVTGERNTDSENAVVDVVRAATIQRKERKRKLFKTSLFAAAILLAAISGLSAMGNERIFPEDNSMLVRVVFMALSFALTVTGSVLQDTVTVQTAGKFTKASTIFAVISLLWIVIMTWSTCAAVINGRIPFGMGISSIGPFIKHQLVILFLANIVMISFSVYRSAKYDEAVHRGWFISLSAIYMAVLYSDMLGNRSTGDGVFTDIAGRTVAVILITVISLTIEGILKKKRHASSD